MKLIWRLIRTQLREHAGKLAARILIVAAVAASPYAFSFLGKWLIDEALQVTGPPKAAASALLSGGVGTAPKSGISIEWKAKTTEQKLRLLAIFLAASLGIHIVVTGLSAGAELLNSNMVQRMAQSLRSGVHEKLETAEMESFGREQVGQLMTRVMDDSGAIPGLLINLVVNLCTQTAMLVLGLALLLRLNPRMALIAVIAMPFFAASCAYFLPKIKRNTEAIRDRVAALQGYLVERLSNALTIKNYAQEAREFRTFAEKVDGNLALSRKQHNLNLYFNTLTTLITGFSTLAVLGYGFLCIKARTMQLGEVMAFYQVTAQLFVPISALVGLTAVAQTLQIHASRVYGVLDTPPILVEHPDPADIYGLRGDIAFEKVSLRYEEGGPFAVIDVSLSIPAGSTVCLVGPTGCGKSTLIALLTRLYDPTEGVLSIDGVDVRRFPIRALRHAVGNVLYQGQVFSGTLRENLTYGDPGAADEDVRSAAELVGLGELVGSLPDGFDTRIGQGGVTLNAAQVTRLCFARALVTDPAILTVDDTYSTLDESAERDLRAAVRGRLEGRTILVATSRLSICEDADMVVVMRAGRIVEKGSHAELINEPGVYRRMYMRQMGLDELEEQLSGS